jgi:predicted small lipoprotein YifL
VTRQPRFLTIAIAMIGAGAATLLLSGCGRKGPLDPPPGGYALDPLSTRTPVTRSGEARPREEATQKSEPTYDENGRPIAPAGQKKRLPGDWLLN